MAHRLLFPCGRSLLLPVALLALLFTFAHCQKQDDDTPPPKASPAAPDCCALFPATGLKEGLGRLVVAFPEGAVPKETRVAALKEGKEATSGHGSQQWELAAGSYDITISDKSLAGVAVQAGQETRVKVGVLHINADQRTRIELIDPANGKVLVSGHGERNYGLPIGPISVQVAGRSETVTIEEGKVTEF